MDGESGAPVHVEFKVARTATGGCVGAPPTVTLCFEGTIHIGRVPTGEQLNVEERAGLQSANAFLYLLDPVLDDDKTRRNAVKIGCGPLIIRNRWSSEDTS